jgi:hypothetical protein
MIYVWAIFDINYKDSVLIRGHYINNKLVLSLFNSKIEKICNLPGNKHKYDLIVQKNEDPRKKFVLVTIEDKTTFIHGWCYGKDAMKDEYWADPARGRPAYFFPKEQLSPLDTLTWQD